MLSYEKASHYSTTFLPSPHGANSLVLRRFMAKDYYEILGLQKGASAEEIKKAYRKLSKELHPDRNKGGTATEARYKEVNEAYEVLSDAKKKANYDQFGSRAGQQGPGGGFDFSGFQNGFQSGDLGGFADLFESFFGGGGGGRKRSAKTQGQDLEIQITVDFLSVVHDSEQSITLQREVTCSDCSGSGNAPGSSTIKCKDCNGTGQQTRTAQSFFGAIRQSVVCPTCSGSGEVPEKPCPGCHGEGKRKERSTITVKIPAGIDNGQTIRLRGEGNAGRKGGAAGDLFIHIRINSHKHFQREGADVHSVESLPLLTAILGGSIHLETVHGSVELKVEVGTQSHTTVRIKNKGFPILGSSRHGDHLVELHVEIPKKLSREEKRLVEEWKTIRE